MLECKETTKKKILNQIQEIRIYAFENGVRINENTIENLVHSKFAELDALCDNISCKLLESEQFIQDIKKLIVQEKMIMEEKGVNNGYWLLECLI